MEKRDINLDYGTYYYADGDRRTDVMEVDSEVLTFASSKLPLSYVSIGFVHNFFKRKS